MGPLHDEILRVLQFGPITARELAARHGHDEASVRGALATLVFSERVCTCDREGRYRLGDPSPLLNAVA